MDRLIRYVSLVFCCLLQGCTYTSQGVVVSQDRHAQAISEDAFGDSAKHIVYLDQNWNRWDSSWFYSITQGSDFIPYDIFVNLEQADNHILFRDPAHLSYFRYLPQRESWNNPDALPVGFVKDHYNGMDYMGFTCAACHTTQINYQQTGIRIDGGPALADMVGMLLALEKAMSTTLNDAEKFQRLEQRIPPKKGSSLRGRMKDALARLREYNEDNDPARGGHGLVYGYGRLDAFGRIYNRILGHLTPEKANFNPANAPVSYPFLWDTPQHDYVQWNGVAANNDGGLVGFLGPLGRNTGEVLGVFATFSLKPQNNHLGFKSSVEKRNLVRIERHLRSLQSPQWPESILPPIDRTLAARGKEVFTTYRCQLCHSDPEQFQRDDPRRRVTAQMASLKEIGTDPTMAMNALQYQGESGLFQGERQSFGSRERFGESTPVLYALQKAATGVIIARDLDKSWIRARLEWLYDTLVALFDNPVREKTVRHVDFEVNNDFPSNLAAYKARPLNGIWATAPYLHNGSVASLYELFLPSCSDAEIATGKLCRANQFTIGSREFDPIKVGFVRKSISQFPGMTVFDTRLPGNSNQGHEYAAGKTPVIKLADDGTPIRSADGNFLREWLPPISEVDRLALVEYLKTL